MNIEEIQAKQILLANEQNRLKLESEQLAKELEILKSQENMVISINFIPPIVQIKTPKYHSGLVELLRNIPMRQYDAVSGLNSIPASYFSELIPKLESLTQVELNWKVSKDEILAFVQQPNYSIDFQDNHFTILVKAGVNDYSLRTTIPQVRLAHKYHFTLGLQEAGRLESFLHTLPADFDITAQAQSELDSQRLNRDKFKIVKSLDVVAENLNILNLELKPFQTVGVEFQSLAGRCIVGDEMGLGKSPQAIGVAVKENDRTLFVVPSQLVLNWARQIQKFTNLEPKILFGTKPSEADYLDLLAGDRKDVFTIIGMGSLSRPIEVKEEVDMDKFSEWANLINISHFDRIVVDEAHYIKTAESNRSWVIRQLKSKKLSLLTGTPVINRPKELWPLLNMIDSTTFNSQSSFEYAYSNGSNGVRNVRELREILEPLMIRRLKSEVQKDLDPINQIVEYIELNPRAKKIYNKCLAGIYENLNTGSSQAITHILALFTRLQQVCTIAKYDHVVDLCGRILESKEGEKYDKVLIGTQYKASAYRIARELDALIITGDINMSDRMKIADKFQNDPNKKFLVCSIDSVQEGLDLTAAGSVINLDLKWTPAAHRQFEGRAFGRLNDSHSIDSYYLLANKTVEEMKWGLLQEKLNTIGQVADGEEVNEESYSVFSEMVKQLKATGFTPLT